MKERDGVGADECREPRVCGELYLELARQPYSHPIVKEMFVMRRCRIVSCNDKCRVRGDAEPPRWHAVCTMEEYQSVT